MGILLHHKQGSRIPRQGTQYLHPLTHFILLILVFCLDLPSDIVPATFKKKKATITARAKGEEGDEKPVRTEESGRTAGFGRGSRA